MLPQTLRFIIVMVAAAINDRRGPCCTLLLASEIRGT
jgi:hypothetical protein